MLKDIYFYWGNSTMSYMRYMSLYSFCKLNPDWNVYLVLNDSKQLKVDTVEKQDKTEFKGEDYYHLVKLLNINTIDFENKMINLDNSVVDKMSDVHIKDILNWKILSEWGGVVADMDILFTKPIGALINDDTNIGLICFSNYPKPNYIPVSFMYSSGNNDFFKKTYNRALSNYNPDVYESCGTLCIEEQNLTEIIKNYPNNVVQRLPDTTVFPFVEYEWNEGIRKLYQGDFRCNIHPDAVGIHWYAGTSQSQEQNNKLNAQTVYEINNTISNSIKEIL